MKSLFPSQWTAVGDSGCKIRLPFSLSAPRHFHEGDRIWVHEHEEQGALMGLICVQLREALHPDHAELVLRRFMRKLRRSLAIEHTTECAGGSIFREFFQYWQDPSGVDWKLRICTDGRRLAVLYVENIHVVRIERVDQFLEGFYWED